ncbi:MAG: hypothetical protein KKG40_01510 [Gammaproteobacteria bacterium]|nr:hypothetical protein [Gammaproteobacteria bacterium]
MSTNFAERMNGQFWGILQWSQLDELWGRLKVEPTGWYASLVGEAPPEVPLAADALARLISEVDALLRREHEFDYCGIVYADDATQPTLVKIYDPNNLGNACGSCGHKIPPRWVLSRMKPERIEDDAPLPGSRRRWWQALFN